VRSLPWTATNEKLKESFSQFGDVALATIVMDRSTNRSKGVCFMIFYDVFMMFYDVFMIFYDIYDVFMIFYDVFMIFYDSFMMFL